MTIILLEDVLINMGRTQTLGFSWTTPGIGNARQGERGSGRPAAFKALSVVVFRFF